MAGWLMSVKGALRKPVERPEQPYAVRCECGRSVQGIRTKKAQTALCPGCRSPLFVFPASVYPLPASWWKSSRRQAPAASRPAQTASGPDSQPSEAPTSARRGKGFRRASRGGTAPAPRSVAAGDETAEGAPVLRPGERPVRRVLTPMRVVLVAITLVIGLTIWWRFHQKELDHARTILVSIPRLAAEALEEGNVGEAARHFQQIDQAVVYLGRSDPQSRQWRQLARETTAAANLLSASLHDIVKEAGEARTDALAEGWPERFRSHYRDEWVIIEAAVDRVQEDSDNATYHIDFPIAIGRHRGRLIAELPAFAQRISPGEASQRVIFAAQLADCRADADRPSSWRVELRADTGFLWGHAETLRLAGFSDDGASLKILAEQAQLLGIEP
ncbi:MAG: hypothetical protein ACKV0T_11550 [Planctomycetales bacterium]